MKNNVSAAVSAPIESLRTQGQGGTATNEKTIGREMMSVRYGVGLGMVAGLLAGCMAGSPPPVTTGGSGLSSATDTPGGIPSMPPDYKKMIARKIVLDFKSDAIGAPEISEISTGRGIFGAASKVTVRYPVSLDVAARSNYMARLTPGTYYRCMLISVEAGVSTLGAKQMTVRTNKVDTTECSPNLNYSRYRELEDMATQCKNSPIECGKVVSYG